MTDRSTGEYIPPVPVLAPVGSGFMTPAQYQARNKSLETKQRKAAVTRASRDKRFYFAVADKEYTEPKPETLARLVYLATFLNYESDKLTFDEKGSKPIKRRDLPKLLGISKASVSQFCKEAMPRFLTQNDNGELFLCNAYFVYGRLSKNQHLIPHGKLYKNFVRRL